MIGSVLYSMGKNNEKILRYTFFEYHRKLGRKKKLEILKNVEEKKNWLRFSVATLFRFVARFARVRIEDSSQNRFALNGIQWDFSGGILSGYPVFDRLYLNNLT